MTQSVVTVRINDQPYQMGCDAGAENHVKTMAEEVNAILQGNRLLALLVIQGFWQ